MFAPFAPVPVDIVPAEPGHAPALAAIYAHHVRHGTATFELDPPDAAEMERRRSKVMSAGWPWLVARDGDGEILAYAYAGQLGARAAYRYSCEDSIYVRHDRLGCGIGTALLARLLTAAEQAGFRQMFALIAGSEGASVALHERAGFTRCGVQRSAGRKHGRWLDVIHMQRALGPGDKTPPSGKLAGKLAGDLE